MKSRSEIWLRALDELGAQCLVDTQRDAETLSARVAREGDSFFKVALPRMGKDFELALSHRRIPRTLFRGFSRQKLKVTRLDADYEFPIDTVKLGGGVPKFLGNFMDLVFNADLHMTAAEFEHASAHADLLLVPRLRVPEFHGALTVAQMADAITAIRQLCLMFGKEKEQCSQPRVDAAYRQYVETDKELDRPLWTSGPTPSSEEVSSLLSGGLSE
jgi:hypothetical protein